MSYNSQPHVVAYTPEQLADIEGFALLDEDFSKPENTSTNLTVTEKTFGEMATIVPVDATEMGQKVRPIARAFKPPTSRSRTLDEGTTMREDIIILGRMNDMKRRMLKMHRYEEKLEKLDQSVENYSRSSLLEPCCEPFEPIVYHSLTDSIPRSIPAAETMSSSQARKMVKEACCITAFHSGFHTLNSQVMDTLTDVGISFITKLGRMLRLEMDRVSQNWVPSAHGFNGNEHYFNSHSNKKMGSSGVGKSKAKLVVSTKGIKIKFADVKVAVPKNKTTNAKKISTKIGVKNAKKFASVSKSAIVPESSIHVTSVALTALTFALRKIGCGVEKLENHVLQMSRFGGYLRLMDRKMLKKGVKAKTAAEKAAVLQGENELDDSMKETLATANLGVAFHCNAFRSTDKPVMILKAKAPSFKKRKLTSVNVAFSPTKEKKKHKKDKITEKKGLSMVDELALPEADLGFGEFDPVSHAVPMKIEHLDIALALVSKERQDNRASAVDSSAAALEAELDLSNLDDLFDGDMLGDDMLPTMDTF